jgi:hypothetical protein
VARTAAGRRRCRRWPPRPISGSTWRTGCATTCCGKYQLSVDQDLCLGGIRKLASGVASLRDQFNVPAANACLADVIAQASDCNRDTPWIFTRFATGGGPDEDPCRRTFTGKKAAGETCQDSIECAPSAGADGRCRGGVCVRLIEGAQVGDPCGEVIDRVEHACDRAAKLVCDPKQHRCRARGSQGASCTGDSDCEQKLGLVCVANICAPPGQTCDDPGCGPDAYCDDNRACVPRHGAGDACRGDNDCVLTAYCDRKLSHCVARAPAGHPCDRENYYTCADATGCYDIDPRPGISDGPMRCLPRPFGLYCRGKTP